MATKTADPSFQRDAEIVVAQVLNGGFMQLWDNYGGRFNRREGMNVADMIERTAEFFQSKNRPDIAEIFAAAAKIPYPFAKGGEVPRDTYGNIDEYEYERKVDRFEKRVDPLESKFYDLWESNYQNDPNVRKDWETYFGNEAKDSPIFREMQKQKPARAALMEKIKARKASRKRAAVIEKIKARKAAIGEGGGGAAGPSQYPEGEGTAELSNGRYAEENLAYRDQANKKYSRLQQVAKAQAKAAAEGLEQLGDAFGQLAESVNILRENLDLNEAPKEASLKERIASRRAFAKKFQQVANENPELLEGAIAEVYQSLDEVAVALENYAANLGLSLEAPPVLESEPEVAQDIIDEAKAEGETPAVELEEKAEGEKRNDEDEHTAAGAAEGAFTSDRDHDGHPKSAFVYEAIHDCPGCGRSVKNRAGVEGGYCSAECKTEFEGQNELDAQMHPGKEAAGNGSDGFITDRDEKGEPKQPNRVEVPRL